MRRSASEIIRNLESRISKLEIRKVARDLITKNRHMEKALKKFLMIKKISLLHKMLSRLYIIVIVLLLILGFLWEVKKVILVRSTLIDIK